MLDLTAPITYPCWVTYGNGTREIVHTRPEFDAKCKSYGTPVEYIFSNEVMLAITIDHTQHILDKAIEAVKSTQTTEKPRGRNAKNRT